MKAELDKLIENTVIGLGYGLVGIDWHGSSRKGAVTVYLEKSVAADNCSTNSQLANINIDDCELVHKQLNRVLEVEQPGFNQRYSLEISSPGVQRPLFKLADYQRFIGSQAKIYLKDLLSVHKKLIGKIIAVDGKNIVLQVDEQEISINIAEIKRAKLV